MDKISTYGFKGKFLSMILLAFLSFFSSAYPCYGAPYTGVDCSKYADSSLKNQCMLKKSFMFDVTTTWNGIPDKKYRTTNTDGTIKHWFVSNVKDESVLYANLRCDGKVISTDFYAQNPCDTNSKNDDWIKTDDLESDANINSPEREYTVMASASDSNGMDSIRIEWANNNINGVPVIWPSSQGHTCNSAELINNGGTCKICREGTLCKNGSAIIPASSLSVKEDGTMNRLWFRIILTDKTGVSIVVGDDKYKNGWDPSNTPLFLDKYYQFQICNESGCSGKCGLAPVISSASVDGSKCADGKPYVFSWNIGNNSQGKMNGQSEFTLELYNAATGKLVDAKSNVPAVTDGNSYSYMPSDWYVGQGGKLSPNTKYNWKVRIKDNASPVNNIDCKQWSQYKNGPTFLTCGGGGGDCIPEDKAPWAVTVKNGNSIKDPCDGYLYTVYWNFFDSDSDSSRNKQAAYQIRVREYNKNNTSDSNILYDSGIANSSNTSHTLTNASWMKYGKTYEWQVRVYDNDPRQKCKKASDWTPWTGTSNISITTPKHKYPTIAFTVANAENNNCVPQGCGFLQDIKFADSGSRTYSSPSSIRYEWYLDGVQSPINTANTFSKIFLKSDGEKHKVTLKVIDEDNYFCEKSADFSFNAPRPVWNEIVPK